METGKFFYASLGRRFLALAIDGILLSVVFFPTTKVVKGVWIMSPADHLWRVGWFVSDPLCMIFLMVIFLYFVALEGFFGRTVGKWILGIRVARKDGGKSGLLRALLRNLLRLVDGLPVFSILGAVLIKVTPEKTRIGDLVAGTRVVKDQDDRTDAAPASDTILHSSLKRECRVSHSMLPEVSSTISEYISNT